MLHFECESKLLASDVVKDGFVFAFEPNSDIFSDLCFNIQANSKKNVVALNLAISDSNQLFKIKHNPAHSGGAFLQKLQSGAVAQIDPADEQLVVAVEPKNLEMLLEMTRDRRIGLKIDVEGHEFNVLHGLQNAGLLGRASWVIVEIDKIHLERHEASVSDIYEMMSDIDFVPAKGPNTSAHYDEIFSLVERAIALAGSFCSTRQPQSRSKSKMPATMRRIPSTSARRSSSRKIRVVAMKVKTSSIWPRALT